MRIWNLLLTFALSVALLWLFAWGVAAPAAALSPIHYVAPGGNCGEATPCYATLQAAIDAAVPGDEVRVAQGVYVDVTTRQYALGGSPQTTITQAMFINKGLTVRGGYSVADWTTPQPASYPTVIDSQGQGRGGVIVSPNPVTLEGLTIVNGYAEGGGGGLYADSSDVVIRDCYVMSSTDGLMLWNNQATLINTVIAANTMTGPTVITRTGLAVVGGEVQAWHTTLADNGGVGLWVQNGQSPAYVAMTNTIVTEHQVGVRVVGNIGDPTIVQLVGTLWNNDQQTDLIDAGGQIINSRDYIGPPEFMGAGDYRLTSTSPARNRGSYSPVRYDIIGVRRDPLPDLGAYEFDDPESIRQVFLPLVTRKATSVKATD